MKKKKWSRDHLVADRKDQQDWDTHFHKTTLHPLDDTVAAEHVADYKLVEEIILRNYACSRIFPLRLGVSTAFIPLPRLTNGFTLEVVNGAEEFMLAVVGTIPSLPLQHLIDPNLVLPGDMVTAVTLPDPEYETRPQVPIY